uniref:Alanine racemase n=1 Tax=Ignavibacterium album TaxID=591197 RepID=A0A832G7B5_9BACT
MRCSQAIINLSNLKKNFSNIRKKVHPAKVMAVVKADAYGHGVMEVVNALNSLEDKPEYYAVALLDEAIQLRENGIIQPILVFDSIANSDVTYYFRYNLIPTIFTDSDIKSLMSAKRKYNYKQNICVHIKVDTGMNRLGVNHKDAFDFIRKVSMNDNFIIDGIYTHFATSDVYNSYFAKLQLKRFDQLITRLKDKNIPTGLIHAANSGAIINMPDSYFDMVRPGISLYGYYPSQSTNESVELFPVMSIVSKVASVKKIKKGDTVSYSRKFKATKPTKIASVSFGYADGYSRGMTNKGSAIIKEKIFRQVGVVTMDRIMFDVGNADIKVGDEVILLGKSKKHEISGWDWCDILKTIPYEITCSISKRVPRIYVD